MTVRLHSSMGPDAASKITGHLVCMSTIPSQPTAPESILPLTALARFETAPWGSSFITISTNLTLLYFSHLQNTASRFLLFKFSPATKTQATLPLDFCVFVYIFVRLYKTLHHSSLLTCVFHFLASLTENPWRFLTHSRRITLSQAVLVML